MVNKILVMGSTGTVGLEVVKCLSTENVAIKAAVHNQKNAAILDQFGIEVVSLDITRHETFKPAFEGVEKLFLLPPTGNIELEFVKNIIDYTRQIQIKNIVLLSMMKAENYERSAHIFIEKYLLEKAIPHVNIRPNFFMQNFNTYYLNHINQKKLINIYDAGVPTSFIDARDIGAVIAKCLLENPQLTKTLTLTGSVGFTHAQVAEILSKASGQPIKYTAKSDEDTHETLLDCGWTDESIKTFFPLSLGVQRGDFSAVHTSVSDILKRPPIQLQQYAKNYQNFWKNQ